MPSEQIFNQQPTSPQSLQEKLLTLLDKELKYDKEFWLPLGFSAIIATLGLITNNAVVVIGAMLMAPLFWPLLGVTIGTITSRHRLLQRSLIFLILSVCLVIALSWMVTIATPITEISDEIKLRANPTLLDLFIALSTSIIAILAVSYPKVSNSIAGVAVSIALLPPLAVVGIGIANQSWAIFRGSLLLFGANIAAIVFTGIVTLYTLGVKPRRSDDKQRWRLGMSLSAAFLILIAVPLTIYFKDALDQARMQTQIKSVLTRQVHEIYDDATVNNLTVNFGLGSDQVDIEATVYLPEGNFLTVANKTQLTTALTEVVNRTINLQLNVIDTLVLRRQDDTELRTLRQQAENWLTQQLPKIDPGMEIQSLQLANINLAASPASQTPQPDLEVHVTARKFTEIPFTFEQKRELQSRLSQVLKRPLRLEIDFIPVTRITSQDLQSRLIDQARQVISQDLSAIDPLAQVTDINVVQIPADDQAGPDKLKFSAIIWLPFSGQITAADRQLVQNHLADQIRRPVMLELRIFQFNDINSPEDQAFSTPSSVLGEGSFPVNVP